MTNIRDHDLPKLDVTSLIHRHLQPGHMFIAWKMNKKLECISIASLCLCCRRPNLQRRTPNVRCSVFVLVDMLARSPRKFHICLMKSGICRVEGSQNYFNWFWGQSNWSYSAGGSGLWLAFALALFPALAPAPAIYDRVLLARGVWNVAPKHYFTGAAV